MKKIYIMLSYTGTAPSKVIKLFSKEKYSHVSIALDSQLKELYSFARKKVNNPFIGGFIKEDINGGIYKKFENTKCYIYSLEVTDEQYETISNIIKDFEIKKHNLHYNMIGLLGVLVNVPIERRNHYFCSQFVSEVLLKSGVLNFNIPSALVQPTHFYNMKDKDVVYTGLLRDYSDGINYSYSTAAI
ncbi:hypothetical protein J2Z44_000245 [Clostridium punense]|uniref:Uncharacterized protein n=1 Tax=Clostridium punense TaxID=1054297 RepID=A0ABS4K181_9CLOT|nr:MULTISPECIES: hypothetical protein [Clostridium]EQB86881.1 hypothetical protein M918_12025 [Clostridium sp. BL8]MBP2020464.1 hypothetical protein [Clostridium punense]